MPENDKKPAGWFSRRHQNRSAHEEARNHYLTTRGKAKRQGVAEAWDDEVVTGRSASVNTRASRCRPSQRRLSVSPAGDQPIKTKGG